MKTIDIIIIGSFFIFFTFTGMNYIDKKFEENKINQSIYFEYKIIDDDTILIDTVFIQRIKAK